MLVCLGVTSWCGVGIIYVSVDLLGFRSLAGLAGLEVWCCGGFLVVFGRVFGGFCGVCLR